MKKISEILEPVMAIVFGTLLLLVYLNWLGAEGSTLALGIVAIVVAGFYIASGLLNVFVGEKMPSALKKVFDILTVCLFPAFIFASTLVTLIEANEVMGPTSWFISIITLVASISLVAFYVVAKFVKNKVIVKMSFLLASIFVLALLLNVLFDINGNPINLGALNIIGVVIYALFSYILFRSYKLAKKGE